MPIKKNARAYRPSSRTSTSAEYPADLTAAPDGWLLSEVLCADDWSHLHESSFSRPSRRRSSPVPPSGIAQSTLVWVRRPGVTPKRQSRRSKEGVATTHDRPAGRQEP